MSDSWIFCAADRLDLGIDRGERQAHANLGDRSQRHDDARGRDRGRRARVGVTGERDVQVGSHPRGEVDGRHERS